MVTVSVLMVDPEPFSGFFFFFFRSQARLKETTLGKRKGMEGTLSFFSGQIGEPDLYTTEH